MNRNARLRGSPPPKQNESGRAKKREKKSDEQVDEQLDKELEDTFPASDPPSLTQEPK